MAALYGTTIAEKCIIFYNSRGAESMYIKMDLPQEAKAKINALRDGVNIVGLSGGKDSMATCILLYYYDIPFITVTAEVWWKEGITGEHPKHFHFLHDKVASKLDQWGVAHKFIRSKKTAYEYMTTPIVKSEYPERVGKLRGFPLCGRCGIQRDCKVRPCEKFYKSQKGGYNVITGIAADEESRIVSNNNNNRISVLEILDVSERNTYAICAGEGLLSPTYTFSNRGGCWFCPNQKIQELELLYREYPHLWAELMEVQRMPNKIQENFTRRQTLYDIEAEIKNGVQMKFFLGELLTQEGEDRE